MLYYLTVALTVASSLLYHVFLKITPNQVNPIFSLFFTYLTATIVTLVIYPFYSVDKGESFWANFQSLNWVSFTLGMAIVGLEVGTLLAYRAGWSISLFNVVASTSVTVLLLPIGVLLFKESLSLTTIAGLVLCVLGLFLINYKS